MSSFSRLFGLEAQAPIDDPEENVRRKYNEKIEKEERRKAHNAKIKAEQRAKLKALQDKTPKLDDIYKSTKPLATGSRQRIIESIINPSKKNQKIAEPALKKIHRQLTNTGQFPKAPAYKYPHNETTINDAGYVIPPFKYLGPGNSLNRGKPYNNIDADAQQHDNQYDKATNQKEIFDSDQEFLSQAGDHIIEGAAGKGSISDSIGAIAGGIGIGAKHLLESAKNKVIYPSNLSGKQWHHLIIKYIFIAKAIILK